MFRVAALTYVDILVFFVLLLIAVVMWAGRKFVGHVLKLLPFVLAVLGTIGSYEFYQLGEHMNWDSPGSAGILVVMFALGMSILAAIAGWIAFARQLRRWRNPGPPQSGTRKTTLNNLRVAGAILFAVWALFSSYRYYRSHVPSHDATVQQLIFSSDGTFLYSLDQSGVLKKWNIQYRFEAKRWLLPGEGMASSLLVSGDGGTLLTLRDTQLTAWSLGAEGEGRRTSIMPDALAAVAVDGENFVLVTTDELSLRSYADPSAARQTRTPRAPALTAAPYADHQLVVGTEVSQLEFYRVDASGFAYLEVHVPTPLELTPRSIRAEATGQFLVVSDAEAKMVIVDLQNMRLDVIPAPFFTNTFEISRQKQLLLAQIGITGYDLPSRSSHPLYNHGGPVKAIAISPTDLVAIGDRNAIWLRTDSRAYADPEVWLNGKVRLSKK